MEGSAKQGQLAEAAKKHFYIARIVSQQAYQLTSTTHYSFIFWADSSNIWPGASLLQEHDGKL